MNKCVCMSLGQITNQINICVKVSSESVTEWNIHEEQSKSEQKIDQRRSEKSSLSLCCEISGT